MKEFGTLVACTLAGEGRPVKTCPACNRELPHAAYYIRKAGPRAGKPRSRCMDCEKAAAKEWGRTNPALVKKRNDLRTERERTEPERRARAAEYQRQWREKNYDRWRERVREGGLRRRYGMGSTELKAMLAAQGNVCALCGTAISWETRHVDHIDTPDGPIVRGILCSKCNNGLGMFMEDHTLLQRAAGYVERHTIEAVTV